MIKLEHYHGKDRVCNYCDRFRRSDADPDVKFYQMRKDGNTGTFIMQMCEYCARDLYTQLSEELEG